MEQVTEATGIKKVVKAIAGDDCGCEKRKEYLNNRYSFWKEWEQEQKDIWEQHVKPAWAQGVFNGEDKAHASKLYSYTFGKNKRWGKCGGCLNRALKQLEKVYEYSCES